jgi:hypothetical protein
MKVDGTWPFSDGEYEALIRGIQKHFANYLRDLEVKLLRGLTDYVMAVEGVDEHIVLKVALDSPFLPRLFDSGYLDCVLEHELRHLDVIPRSKICALVAPDVVYREEDEAAHAKMSNGLNAFLQDMISEVFAISRMSESGQKKYLEFECLKLEVQWKQSEKITSGESLKAFLIMILAELELIATKMSCSLPARFASMKAIAAPNADDEAFYDETVTLYDLIWEQAKRESPVLADEAATRRLREILRTQKEPYVPRGQGAWGSLEEIT